MSRVLWRLVAWGLLLPLFGLLFLPLSEWGSKQLLDNVGRMLPIEIEYGGGRLAGELRLKHVGWGDDDLRLDLQDVVIELSPVCLWHSRICFEQLSARQLDLTILPGPAEAAAGPGAVAGDDTLFAFPVPLEAAHLQLDSLRVAWQGGEWRQGEIEGAVRISGSMIKVTGARLQGASLSLSDAAESSGPVQLPEIDLPLQLAVDELVLVAGTWDLYGAPGELDSLRLSGSWSRKALRLDALQLRAAALGQWEAHGSIDFSGQWPLALTVNGVVPDLPGWPTVLDRGITLDAGGDLAALSVQAQAGGRVTLAVKGSLNTLSPELPFSLVADADWARPLALSELAEMPESLAAATASAPLKLTANGSLDDQAFQLETTVSGLGYESLALRLAGSHEPGRVVLEDMRLGDAGGDNTLWGTGALDYAGQTHWSAVLETSGLDLLPLSQYGAGRVDGQVQLRGDVAAGEWAVSLLGADLRGTLNNLPVRLKGYAGIDSRLQLQPTELRAELNGTRLLLQSASDASGPARLAVELADLGLWLPGSHGSLSLQASLMPGWQDFSATGTLRELDWQDLKVGSGTLAGAYHPGRGDEFRLDVNLADLALGGMELDTAQLLASGNADAQKASLRSHGDVSGQLDLAGKTGAGGLWSGELAATTLQTREGNWYLGEPVAIEYSPSPARLRLAAHCWHFGQSRLCPGEALVGEEGSASLALEGDLAAFAPFLPDYLELKGAVAGQVAARWAPGQVLAVDAEMRGSDIRLTRNFGGGESGSVAWQRIEASAHNDASGLSLASGVYAADSRVLDLELHLAADRSEPLSGTLGIAGLQLAKLAPLAPGVSTLEGELQGSLRLAGTVDRPLAEGSIKLSGGRFALLDNPTELQQLELQLDALGDAAAVRGGGVLGGGKLGITGRLLSEPEWRIELSVDGDHHEILLPPSTQILVSEQLDLAVTGGLLDLGGNIVVHKGTLEHERLPEDAVTLSEDVVEVDLTGNVIYEPAPFDTSMNVGLLVENDFKIVGDMVNATVGGDLQLRQQRRQPLQLFGNLNVIGGELRAYQQRLRIQRGTVSFAGTPENPELDVRAQREIPGDKVVVGLQLQGTLKQPKLEVYSDPVMAHGEAMSYLVRGRGLDSGAGADGVAMALSLGTGLVNQSALVTELNSIPGISNIAFGSEGSNESDTAATVGGYIGERLYLSYGMGIYEPINVLTARLYLQTRLWLEVVSRLENSMDLYYSFDID